MIISSTGAQRHFVSLHIVKQRIADSFTKNCSEKGNYSRLELNCDLKPFSAGQTSDGTFGVLTRSGSKSSQLIMTSTGEISLGTGISSIFGIDSTPDGLTKGRYYLNGFTITIEFNGNVYHTFVGINSESNGTVESLFLASRYYSVNL